MMASLSKEIEAYLKMMLEEEAGYLEIKRSFLSETFSCVPSQINYVLSTRFTLDQGYIVESRRGGGGYLRIRAIPLEGKSDLSKLKENLSDEIGLLDLERILGYLHEENMIEKEFMQLFNSLLGESVLSEVLVKKKTSEARSVLLKNLLARLALFSKS